MLNIEYTILNAIQEYIRNPVCDFLMPLITHLGDFAAIWLIVAGALSLSQKYRRLGLAIFLAIILDYLVTHLLLKTLAARARPCWVTTVELLISCPKGFSFPSGHAASSFAAASVLAINRFTCWPAFLGLAALIAFSRLYLYVHFPSDVIVGVLIGTVAGIGANYLLKRISPSVAEK